MYFKSMDIARVPFRSWQIEDIADQVHDMVEHTQDKRYIARKGKHMTRKRELDYADIVDTQKIM